VQINFAGFFGKFKHNCNGNVTHVAWRKRSQGGLVKAPSINFSGEESHITNVQHNSCVVDYGRRVMLGITSLPGPPDPGLSDPGPLYCKVYP